ncbi:hypothetical protein BDR22DRAFT_976500 [Usnea florida]
MPQRRLQHSTQICNEPNPVTMNSFPGFPYLPNEIRLLIIETTDPEDIEHLALSCRTVYSLSRKTLARHQLDKAKWSHLKLRNHLFHSYAECPKELLKLREVVPNKRLHRYPSHLTIYDRDCWTAGRIDFSVYLGVERQVAAACPEIFKDLSSPYMTNEDKATWFHKLVTAKGDVPPNQNRTATVNPFILAFLPNVKKITIIHPQPLNSEIANMIQHVSKTNHDAPLYMKNRLSLTKLSLVEIDIRDTTPVPYNNGILEAFLTLPSLQALRLSNLDPNYKINKPLLLPPTPHPNLTQLHFVHCSISHTQLSTLLAQTTSLRLFSYDHATDTLPPPLPKRNTLGPLLDLVRHHAKSTLTYLNCTTSTSWPGDEAPHCIGPVGSFRAYENLSTMRLSRAVLLENINTALPRRLAKICAPKKLVDELPASLKQLELVGQFSAAEASYLFSDLLERRMERLPWLRGMWRERSDDAFEEQGEICGFDIRHRH